MSPRTALTLLAVLAPLACSAANATHDASATDGSGSGATTGSSGSTTSPGDPANDDAGFTSSSPGSTDDSGLLGPSADDGGSAPSAARDASAPSDGGFVHPGVLDSLPQLDFVKAKIAAGTAPWTTALSAASSSTYGATTYTPAPVADVVCGPYSNPDIGCTAEKDDASAAYTQALLWYFTGKDAYAQKSIAIMNAWSSTITEHTNSNAPLQSAWVASVWTRAAEIVRYTSSDWSAADVAQFAAMLKNVYLPEVVNGAPKENGNWELSMTEATMGIGVFLDDQATFQKALALWRGRVPAYVYLSSDGPTPVLPPGGAVSASGLATFWYGQTTMFDGLAQETCRDLGHVQYGLAAMINAAETARIQGVDLYSEEAPRLTAALEFHANFLDGAKVPSTLCSGTLNAVTPDPMWEIAFNEYAGRLGSSLPSTQTLIGTIRPTGADHHMDWETLTHAEIGSVGLP